MCCLFNFRSLFTKSSMIWLLSRLKIAVLEERGKRDKRVDHEAEISGISQFRALQTTKNDGLTSATALETETQVPLFTICASSYWLCFYIHLWSIYAFVFVHCSCGRDFSCLSCFMRMDVFHLYIRSCTYSQYYLFKGDIKKMPEYLLVFRFA